MSADFSGIEGTRAHELLAEAVRIMEQGDFEEPEEELFPGEENMDMNAWEKALFTVHKREERKSEEEKQEHCPGMICAGCTQTGVCGVITHHLRSDTALSLMWGEVIPRVDFPVFDLKTTKGFKIADASRRAMASAGVHVVKMPQAPDIIFGENPNPDSTHH